MIIEIRKDGGDWTLFVDGTAMVQRESFTVVDRIAYELEHPGVFWPSEAHEVAESIRRWRAS